MATRKRETIGRARPTKKVDTGPSLYKDPENRNPLQLINDWAKGPEWNAKQKASRERRAAEAKRRAGVGRAQEAVFNRRKAASSAKAKANAKAAAKNAAGKGPNVGQGSGRKSVKYPAGKTPNIKPLPGTSKVSKKAKAGLKAAMPKSKTGKTRKLEVSKPHPVVSKYPNIKPKPKKAKSTTTTTTTRRRSGAASPKRVAASKAYKGQSSKRAVRNTLKKVESRGGMTGRSALKQARRMVRDRKARASKR